METFIQHLAVPLYDIFRKLGLFGVFFSMFGENVAIPIPLEIGYLLAVNMIVRHRYSVLVVLLVLIFGHVLGAITGYIIGEKGGEALDRRFRKNKRYLEIHEKVHRWYQKYGSMTVFGVRFLGYVRPWSSFIAGYAGFAFGPFLLWTTLGSIIFNIIALYTVWLVIGVWKSSTAFRGLIVFTFALSFFAIIIYGLAIKIINNRKNGQGKIKNSEQKEILN